MTLDRGSELLPLISRFSYRMLRTRKDRQLFLNSGDLENLYVTQILTGQGFDSVCDRANLPGKQPLDRIYSFPGSAWEGTPEALPTGAGGSTGNYFLNSPQGRRQDRISGANSARDRGTLVDLGNSLRHPPSPDRV